MSRYRPATGAVTYRSFQEFFTRTLHKQPVSQALHQWPVQGFVCDFGLVEKMALVRVKRQTHSVRKIFGELGRKIPGQHFFVNIFLHNHNYHRFHSPVSGTIAQVRMIPGKLTFLRPWLYPRAQASEPSFHNERVVLEIEDSFGQSWFLAFVGGMGVGQIELSHSIEVGAQVEVGQEIGLFLLGSTCCMAIPIEPIGLSFMKPVDVGEAITQHVRRGDISEQKQKVCSYKFHIPIPLS